MRNIHLGADFRSIAGTEVRVPINGKIHSYSNNATIGDYGLTIILYHETDRLNFHMLYSYLSLESIEKLYGGKQFKRGEVLGILGTTAINVNNAPHLHFKLIIDMVNNKGDYTGACS